MAKLRRLAIVFCFTFAGLCIPANGQDAASDAMKALAEARLALDQMPGNEKVRNAFTGALEKAIVFERDGRRFKQANTLVNELVAQLDLRLSVNPTDTRERWRRYQALKIKYYIVNNSTRDLQELEQVAIKAEDDARTLLSGSPERAVYQLEHARALSALAWHYVEDPDRSKAATLYAKAIELAREVLDNDPKESGALYVLAVGAYRTAWASAQDADTYEAYEALIPLYENAALAYKHLVDVNGNPQTQYARSQVWFELANTYQELGDDAESFKAARTGFHFLEIFAETMPDNDQIVQQIYLTAGRLMQTGARPEDKIIWGEKTRDLIIRAGDNGHLRPQDTGLLPEVERTIDLNKRLKNASSIEDIQRITAEYRKELEADGIVVRDANIELQED